MPIKQTKMSRWRGEGNKLLRLSDSNVISGVNSKVMDTEPENDTKRIN